MNNILNNTAEEFLYLSKQEREIKNKTTLTEEDRENLEIIANLKQELNEKLTSYNNQGNQQENVEKAIREKFDENKAKIDAIIGQSKKMKPQIEGRDKTNKKAILEGLGFVETLTANNGKIYIHSSLVGKYFDLVKQQRILSQELKKEFIAERDRNKATKTTTPKPQDNDNQEKEQIEKEELQPELTEREKLEQIRKTLLEEKDRILNQEHGRKVRIKYKGEKYYLPERLSRYFTSVLMPKLEEVERKLNPDIDLEKDTEKNETNVENQNKKEEEQKTQEIKTVRKPKPSLFKRIMKKIPAIATALFLAITGGHAIAKVNDFSSKDIPEDGIEKMEDIQTTYSKDAAYYPKFVSNPEKTQPQENTTTPEIEFVDMQPLSEQPIEKSNYLSDDEKFLENNKQNNNSYTQYNVESPVEIGSEVTVSGNIYKESANAYLQQEAMMPTFDAETKRIVLGVGVEVDGKIIRNYASTENANQNIQNLLNNGGEVVTVLTANKDKYLAAYGNTQKITEDQVVKIAEGWYNINDINLENRKGISR